MARRPALSSEDDSSDSGSSEDGSKDRSFNEIYADFEVRLLREGRLVLVKDEAHEQLLEDRLAALGSADHDPALLVRITDEERSFFEALKREFFLGGKKERTQKIIAELRAIQKIKGADRGTYDSDDALIAMHEDLLRALSSVITPYGYEPDTQEDFLRRKSLDIIVETYLDDKRLNKRDYSVTHPIGMARAVSFLGSYFNLDKDVVLVCQLAALRHDVHELLDERLQAQDRSGLSKRQRAELKRRLNDAYDPEKKFKIADKRIRNYMILHAVEQGMEPDQHLLDIVDAVRYTSVHLTKPMGVSWDRNFKKAVKKRTIEDALGRWCVSEEKRKKMYPLVRAGVIIDKLCDEGYNSNDFDDIRIAGEAVFSLKKRMTMIYKTMQLFNALSQEYAAGNFEGEDYHMRSHVLLKKAMMYFTMPQAEQMLEYVVRNAQEELSDDVIREKIVNFVTYDSTGYDVARPRQTPGEHAKHPDREPDGTLWGLRRLVREKDMTEAEQRRRSEGEYICLESHEELFRSVLALRRLAEHGFMAPYRIIRNF